jgi:hypothetical protein
MKTFFVLLGVILALLAWFTGAAVLVVWVEATFGEEWGIVPFFVGFAPLPAAVIAFVVHD